ncbi:MAG: DNA adenine methylase [Polyangiaceae bacterium]|nr:DNA adenine methylase [Polyangiaceae bacterium]
MAPAAPDPTARAAKPFVKWAGGKRQLLGDIVARVPRFAGRYFEPFVGGGAVFFHLAPKRAVLADTNERLIRTYLGVQKDVEGVIRLLSRYPYDEEFFYRLRDKDIDKVKNDVEVAAWLIYLNKAGYNGLYRVNSKNGFNVPFGRHTSPNICDPETLRLCSQSLARAKLEHADFEAVVKTAREGDFVYFDPPYVPLSSTSYFASYTKDGFGPSEQERLRDVALELKRRGVHVLLSNSSAPFVQRLYSKGFRITKVLATRNVNSKASHRGAILELLIE